MHTDQEETREVQENRIEHFKKKSDQQFTVDVRKKESTVDLVLHKVNGPEDAVVREMIKHLLLEKIYTITRCLRESFMGQMEAPSSWKIVK